MTRVESVVEGRSICVVVPCFNEEAQIHKVLTTLPGYVTAICVIDDCSTDATLKIVEEYKGKDSRIHLIRHDVNQGVGGAIATGYKWARDQNCDVAVVMAGDAQMSPSDLPNLLKPIFLDQVDYTKGNRLLHVQAERIPRVRFFGNAVLSMLTKIASGYWHIADSQCGYTAISRRALHMLDWDRMYKRYGQPNDLLVMLNVHDMRVRDVDVEPLYGVGERSGFRAHRMIWPIGRLLWRRFFWRLKWKYVVRDFHPLVLFYSLALLFGALVVFFLIRLVMLWVTLGYVPELTALATMFCFSTSFQALFFAMWMDMEANRSLR